MWFHKMGIYGMDAVENAIISGLVTGDPVLLIGTHGTAKTLLCRKLAEALGLKFIAYDASKALFEDLIGFPNPESISKGIIEYVPTYLSIWDKEFILIDEISRARPEMQNKWLEIIRARQVMGLKAQKLRYIFAAMNPPSYAGANPLDEALAGRFAFIIKVPQISEMKEENIKMIINNVTEEDGFALAKAEEKKLDDSEKKEFLLYIEKIRGKIKNVSEMFNNFLDDYILRFMFFAGNKGFHLDGRRVNMMKRNIIAYISVYLQNKNIDKIDNSLLKDLICDAIKFSMPFEVCNFEISNKKILYIHDMAFDVINYDSKKSIYKITSAKEAEAINQELIEKDYQLFRNALTKVIEKVRDKTNIEEKAIYMEILRVFAKKIINGEIRLESNDEERVLELYKGMYDLSCLKKYDYSGMGYYSALVYEGLIDTTLSDISCFKIVMNTISNNERNNIDMQKLRECIRNYRQFSRKGEKNENKSV